MRHTGIDVIGDVQWGTHFCQFYENSQDLVETLVPYFREGLSSNEFCMWVTSEPLGVLQAKAALNSAVPDLDRYFRKGQIEIIDYKEWYVRSDKFSADEVLKGWVDKLAAALDKGFEGLRLSGNTFWLEKADWDDFRRYEEAVNSIIGRYKMLAICTYSLEKCGAMEILDVVANHEFALIKRQGRWETIESRAQIQTEQELKEARDHLENLLNYANAPIIVWDSHYKITRFNHAFERLTGLAADEVIGRQLDILFPQASRDESLAHIKRTLGGERWVVVEIPILRTDGSIRTVLWNSANIYDKDETTITATIAQGQDITERKQAEVALRKERDFSTAVLDTAGALVVVLDTDGKITRFNRACEAMTSYSEAEVLGRVFWEFLVPEEDMPGVKLTWEALRAGDFPNRFENNWITKHGSRRLVAWSNTAMLNPDGRIEHIIGTGIDITERKHAEEELRLKRDHLENLIDYANAPIIVWDPFFKITRFNHAFERLTGLTAGEVIGRPLDLLFPEASRDESLGHIKRTLAGERWEVVEIPILRVDGEVRTVLWNSANIYDRDGVTITATIAQGQDITERKHAEEDLRRHAEEIDRARAQAENEKLRLEAVMEALPVGVAITDVWGGNIEANSTFERIWAGPRPAARSVSDYAAYKAWWTDTGQPLAPEEWASAKVIEKGEPVVGQMIEIERFDGSRAHVINSASPVRDAAGKVVGSAVAIQDISELRRSQEELRRLNRTLTALSHSNQALMRAQNEKEFLAEACQIIVRDCGHAMVWIGYAENDEEKSVRPVAFAGFEDGYIETLKISWDDTERGLGPTGTAIRTGRPCVCANMLTDPKFAPWRDQALARGYASSLVLPLLTDGRAFGAISIYFKDPGAVSEDEMRLLTELAGDVAYGITSIRLREAHARAEQALQLRSQELQRLTETLEQRVQERTAELGQANDLLRAEITHSRMIESDLKQQRETLQTLIDNIPVMLCFYDTSGRAKLTNREFERLLGWSKQEAEALDIAPAKMHKAAAIPVREATAAEGIPGWQEYTLKTREGAGLESSWATVRLSDGGQIGIGIDMRERRAAEEDRLRLAAAVGQVKEGMAITDAAGHIEYLNPAFENTSGFGRAELLGKSYYDLLIRAGADQSIGRKAQKTAEGGEAWNARLVRKRGSEQTRELDIMITPIRDRSGNIINYLVIERDVTHEARLQQHLRQAQKMEALGTLAGGIAHDFNNILNPIFINTELVLMDAALDSAARRDLETVLKAAERGRDLVKQIITFSRQKEKERRPSKVGPVIKEALKFLRSSLPVTVEIRQKIEPESGFIQADPSQIHQVVMNLCNNAAYAMQERGGVLDVSLGEVEVDTDMAQRHPDLKPGPYLRLTVGDTGTGMTPEVMERAFDPFFTTKKHGEGSGMGLALVHGIVNDYNGAITVYSEVGKGTTFNVFFPRIKAAETRPEGGAENLPRGGGRILLVDDERVQVQSMRNILKRLGYLVAVRSDAEQALKAFRKDPSRFDLVITDQTMPKLTGVQLAARLLELRPGLPIILCTGFSEQVDSDGARAMGIRGFLMKPFSIGEMATAIKKALEK